MKRSNQWTSNTIGKTLSVTIPTPSTHQSYAKLQLTNHMIAAQAAAKPPRSTNTKELFMKRSTIFAGGFAALALVAGIAAYGILHSPSAAAQVVDKSKNKVVNLSEADYTRLGQRIGVDPKAILDEARNARDLQEVSCAVDNSLPPAGAQLQGKAVVTMPDGSTKTVDSSDLSTAPSTNGAAKCLSFTRADGAKTTLGLDTQDLPVLVTLGR